jgi:branched-chain amino acid transport system permease protein
MFLQQIMNGLIMGGAYALISVGLTMSFGIMHISNFAHGTILMIGGYAVYFFCMYLGLPYFVGVVLSMVSVGLFGIILERVVFKQVYNAPHMNDMLVSLGLLIVLEGLSLVFFGSETLKVNTPYTSVIINVFSSIATLQRIIVLVASLLLIQALYLFLKYTKTGRSIVATAQNPRGASLVGIDIPRVYMLTFAISSALAAAAGALLSPVFYVYPTMGAMPLLIAFVVVVFGGMGSVQGAVVGGFAIGILESLGGAYISSDYKNCFPFIILIATLLIRPQGLFGNKELS